MQKNEPIFAECPLFVCRECHTKTGHPHQHWCTLTADGTDCSGCMYWHESRKKCTHPYRKKTEKKHENN